jgi:hypothetical protein
LIFSNGICAVTTQPLLADYVKQTSKGYAGGIIAFLSGIGALIAIFGLMKLTSFLSIGQTYTITAAFSLFVSVFCIFGIKNVKMHVAKSCKERW